MHETEYLKSYFDKQHKKIKKIKFFKTSKLLFE